MPNTLACTKKPGNNQSGTHAKHWISSFLIRNDLQRIAPQHIFKSATSCAGKVKTLLT